ncbi:hypothetical protein BY996DRAFT_8401172 [Phakopsora pachyrhizi]|nr:hypothetical protein BY996DRAFT_6607162 [Phakopsora pachyrhizi]KAI8444803.1 hypothetical protein BY996DRAFT_8401172 [Phakopsora pachyrhizi]
MAGGDLGYFAFTIFFIRYKKDRLIEAETDFIHILVPQLVIQTFVMFCFECCSNLGHIAPPAEECGAIKLKKNSPKLYQASLMILVEEELRHFLRELRCLLKISEEAKRINEEFLRGQDSEF